MTRRTRKPQAKISNAQMQAVVASNPDRAMTSVKKIRTDTEGTTSEVLLVGFHGRIGPNQTPARREPVYADAEDRMVTIVESNPLPGQTLSTEVAARPIVPDVWATTGTRIDPPWPMILGRSIVVVGEQEMAHAPALAHYAGSNSVEQEQVSAFVAWLTTGAQRDKDLRCARVDHLAVWYCTRRLADALLSRIASVARQELHDYAGRGDLRSLKRASFWLSRAAIENADIYLSAAGLRRAGYPHWEALLHAGVRSGTEYERLAAVEKANSTLELSEPAPMRNQRARRAVVLNNG